MLREYSTPVPKEEEEDYFRVQVFIELSGGAQRGNTAVKA